MPVIQVIPVLVAEMRLRDEEPGPVEGCRETTTRRSTELPTCINCQDRHAACLPFEPRIVQHVGHDTNVVWDDVHLLSDFKPVVRTTQDGPVFLVQACNARLRMSDDMSKSFKPKQVCREYL